MKRFNYLTLVLGACLLLSALSGCQEAAKQCGFECAAEGIAKGNASITGVASIDGFFASVVNFTTKANAVADGINAELMAIAGLAGMDVTGKTAADLDFGADFQAALVANFGLDADAGLKVDFQEPKCEVSAKATIEATAQCDAKVEPGSVKAECSGKCEVDPAEVDLEASCSGEAKAELKCTGTAPNLVCDGTCTGGCELDANLECSGTCTGSCNLEVAAECSGTCTGSCDLEVAAECSGVCEGTCEGSTDSGGHCDGKCQGKCNLEAGGSCSGKCQGKCELSAGGSCSGKCEGKCELSAGAKCSGKCTGSCEYTPPEAKCEGGATATVECKAEGSVEPPKVNCDAKCSGEVTPPKASAECQAKAKADAQVNAECTPPSIAVTYKLKAIATGDAAADAEANAAAQAKFEAFLTQFKAHLGAIIAMKAQAKFVVDAGAGILTAASGAISKAGAELQANASAGVLYKLTNCLPAQLNAVPKVIGDASANLEASVSGTVDLLASLGKS